MKRILVIYENETTTQVMLCDFLKKYALITGNDIVVSKSIKVKANQINWCDYLITIRSMSPFDLYIVKKAKLAGKKCIAFWDDDLTENTKELFILKKRRDSMKMELQYVDAILSPNLYLLEKLNRIGTQAKTILLDTAVDEKIFQKYKNNDSKIMRIVYAAGPSHKKDFTNDILEALRQLSQKFPKSFDLSFVGVHPDIGQEVDFSIYYHPCMNYEDYHKHMLAENYDVGIAPLEDNEFTKSKYYNKFIDYTINNIVGVYSNCLPYTLIVKDGVNGFLVNKGEVAWFEIFQTLLLNKELREKCLNNSQEQLRKQFSLQTIVKGFDKELLSIPDNTVGRTIRKNQLLVPKIKYLIFKYFYLPCVYIHNIGLKGMFERLNNYLISISIIKGRK